MAPMKRPSATPAGAPSKKKAVDPVEAKCKIIIDAMKEADESVVPASAIGMLVPMIQPCLSVPKDKRHEVQVATIDNLEKTLADMKTAFEKNAENLKATVEGALAERVTRKEVAATAKAAIAGLTEAVKAGEESVATTKEAQASAAKSLKEAEKVLKDATAELQTSTKKKEELTKCLEALSGYETAVPDGSAEAKATLKLLTKVSKQLEVEAVLLDTVNKAIKKEAASRAEFDNMSLGHLREIFQKKLAELSTEVEAKEAALKAAEAASATTKETKTTADQAVKTATAALAAAKSAEKEGLAASKTADAKVESWLKDMEVILNQSDDAADALVAFLEGPVAAFAELKELPVPVEEPEAPAAEAPAPEAEAEVPAAEVAA